VGRTRFGIVGRALRALGTLRRVKLTPELAERVTEGDTKRRSWVPSLYLQVLIAIVAAVLLGWRKPEWGIAMSPLGTGFVKLIKMLIGPIVFTTVVVGIAGMKDLKKVGRVGGKALLWFELMTTVALLIGMAMAHLVHPGSGIHASLAKMDTAALDKTLAAAPARTFVEHLLAIIPESFVGAFVSGDVLQILLLGVLTGIALAGLGQRAEGGGEAARAVRYCNLRCGGDRDACRADWGIRRHGFHDW